ncbi:hypothetical protein NEMIN01_1375 [Nematocida minor]|uniref:uncharacterized protein n=1 Tax=Nematocida minor TaxID=1912983 RepID=UPI00221EBB0D|nr:uncharacterized protein NEMIN01_1375 [Nematocida minor]KAI5191106.1 hypothetical protein NEMIN01_1375 [Nematocida minor]
MDSITTDSYKLSNENELYKVKKKIITGELSANVSTSPQMGQVIGTPVSELTGLTFYNAFNNGETEDNRMEDVQIPNLEKGSNGELDNHQEENEDIKYDKELELSNGIVKFLRNIKCSHPVAFNRTFAAVSITLFIIGTYMPFYGKILLCLLELVLIVVNIRTEKTYVLARNLYLIVWFLLASFSLIIWPISAYACILMFIYSAYKLVEESVRKKDYLGFIISVLGPVFIVMPFIFTSWVQLVKPNMICVSAVSLFFFMTTFCSTGAFYKLVKLAKIIIDLVFYNSIMFLYIKKIEIKNQELDRLKNRGASQNKEKIDELKKEIKALEQNLKIIKGKINNDMNLDRNIYLDEMQGPSPYVKNFRILKSFSKYWFIILPVVSIVAGTGFVFITCYLNSKMPVSEYIPVFFEKLKESLLLGSRVISNTSA